MKSDTALLPQSTHINRSLKPTTPKLCEGGPKLVTFGRAVEPASPKLVTVGRAKAGG